MGKKRETKPIQLFPDCWGWGGGGGGGVVADLFFFGFRAAAAGTGDPFSHEELEQLRSNLMVEPCGSSAQRAMSSLNMRRRKEEEPFSKKQKTNE